MSNASGQATPPTGFQRLPFLAADVGGTHARVALARSADGGHDIELLAYRKYACADFEGLPALLRAFLDADVTVPVRHCVVACAGQLIDDVIVNDNLAWRVCLSQLRHALGFDDVAFLNDFEALAYALEDVRSADSQLLCGPDVQPEGPALALGPGTGLGAAVRLADDQGVRVLASEGGQADLAPGTARERAVLEQLAAAGGYVSYERILSGPGLLTLYSTLCALRGRAPELASPEAVTAAARGATDPEAVETLDIFCGLLGSFVGNLALMFMARGGVYLAGGILPEIRGLLGRSSFAERFLDKGGMRAFLLRVPVRLIEHGRHGVLGAARWYLDRPRQGPGLRRAVGGGVPA